jgi:hypothetical protein
VKEIVLQFKPQIRFLGISRDHQPKLLEIRIAVRSLASITASPTRIDDDLT